MQVSLQYHYWFVQGFYDLEANHVRLSTFTMFRLSSFREWKPQAQFNTSAHILSHNL